MIKNLLSFVFLFISIGLFAQIPFSVSDTVALVNSPMDDDIEAHIGVANLTDSTINVVWVREEVMLPAGWASAICDPVRCWDPAVSSKTFNIEVGARDIEVIGHVYPELNTPGTAVIRVELFEDNHPDLNVFLEYTFNVGLSTGLSQIEQRSVKVFPNPSQGDFAVDLNLSTSKDVQLRIVNALGQMVHSQSYGNISGQHRLTYDGDRLNNGLYYLMLDVDEATSAFKLMVAR